MHFMVLRLWMLFPLIANVGVCGVPIRILEVIFHWFVIFLPTQAFHSVTMLHYNFLEHYLTFDSSFTIHDPAFSGPGSVVSIATDYGLDGPGIESWWGGEIFRACPARPWGLPSLLYNGYRVFPGGKKQPGRDADPSPPLVPWSWKSRAIPLLPYWLYGL